MDVDLKNLLGRAHGLVQQLCEELAEVAGDVPTGEGVRTRCRLLQDCLDEIESSTGELTLELGLLDLIVRHRPPETALMAALHYLTERLGLHASALRLREGEDFPYFATTGFSEEFVAAESSLCSCHCAAAEPKLDCLCGTVIRGDADRSRPFFTARGSFWTNNASQLLATRNEEPSLAEVRGRCHSEGYESVVLIPLRSEHETFGLLQFNDRRRGRFSEQRVAVLEEMADYLAHLLV